MPDLDKQTAELARDKPIELVFVLNSEDWEQKYHHSVDFSYKRHFDFVHLLLAAVLCSVKKNLYSATHRATSYYA